MTKYLPVLCTHYLANTSDYTQRKQWNRPNPHHASHWSADALGTASASKGMPVFIVGAERRISGAVGSEALIRI